MLICISLGLSTTDTITLIIGIITIIVLIVTAKVLYNTLKALQKGNEDNSTNSRIQSAVGVITKQIEFHYELRKELKLAEDGDSFKILYQYLDEIYSNDMLEYPEGNEGELQKIRAAFQNLYDNHGYKFGTYYKNLYFLVRYTDRLTINDGFDKLAFFDLIKAQLSKFELLLLFYDCLWIQDKPAGENFIDYIKAHNLLSAMESDLLIKASHLELL